MNRTHSMRGAGRAPHEFARRVLLLAVGQTPQVVTETVYALAVGRTPAFVPTEVVVVTTTRGKRQLEIALLRDQGWFERLRDEWDLPTILFNDASIEVIRDADGVELDDIRSIADNEAAANCIASLVRRLSMDPESALHVSLAGGRKTMSYYAGYSLSLFGRPQDRLSHVLVDPVFESCADFFFPTRRSRRVVSRLGGMDRWVDCRDAQVTLAEIPFVRLRSGMPGQLLLEGADFMTWVDRGAAAVRPARLMIDLAAKQLWAQGIELPLEPSDKAVLAWLAIRVADGVGGVRFRKDDPVESDRSRLLDLIDHFSRGKGRSAGSRTSFNAGFSRQVMSMRMADINKVLKRALGDDAERYSIRQVGHRGAAEYTVGLDASAIEVRGSDVRTRRMTR